MGRRIHFLLLPVLLVTLGACEVDQTEPDASDDVVRPAADVRIDGDVIADRIETEEVAVSLVRIVGGLENPWGLAFLPDGRILVTERPGRLNLVENGQVTQVTGLPDIRAERQGGLLDIALHPDYDNTGWIYFTYSAPGDGGMGTALSRARLDGTQLVDLENLYTMEQMTEAGHHFGSRITFMNDGTLLFTIGDRGQMERSQDPMDAAGSTIRLTLDGDIPNDNPFVGQDGYLPELYTFGNRNSQGMAVHPQTGEVWQTEHGPRGGDELNLIQAGANYGWPDYTDGRDYRTREQIGQPHDQAPAAITNPVEIWTPAIAPSGTTFYTGDAFPQWQNNLFVGSLVQQKLIRLEMDGHDVTHQEDLIQGEIGRIREVAIGPDGYIYLLTDASDGGIYRLQPADL